LPWNPVHRRLNKAHRRGLFHAAWHWRRAKVSLSAAEGRAKRLAPHREGGHRTEA